MLEKVAFQNGQSAQLMFHMKIIWLSFLIRPVADEVVQASTCLGQNLLEFSEERSKKDLTEDSQKMFMPNGRACRNVLRA